MTLLKEWPCLDLKKLTRPKRVNHRISNIIVWKAQQLLELISSGLLSMLIEALMKFMNQFGKLCSKMWRNCKKMNFQMIRSIDIVERELNKMFLTLIPYAHNKSQVFQRVVDSFIQQMRFESHTELSHQLQPMHNIIFGTQHWWRRGAFKLFTLQMAVMSIHHGILVGTSSTVGK